MKPRFRSGYGAIAVLGLFLALALGAGGAAADSDEEFIWLAGAGPICGLPVPDACPDVSSAANGDTIEIRGLGTFETEGDVSGGGTFVHKDASGAVLASGEWTAEDFVSFVSYGSGDAQGLPPNFFGGLLVFEVELDPAGSKKNVDAVLSIECELGANIPAGAHEGISLDVEGGPNFNTKLGGLTLFVLQDDEDGAEDGDEEAQADGNFQIVSSVLMDQRIKDGVIVQRLINVIDFTGTLEGTAICDTTARGNLATGAVRFRCSGTFAGTVNGAWGTLNVAVTKGTGNFFTFTFQARFEFSDGTGALEETEVEGTFKQVGFSGTYSGEVEFD